MELTSQDLLAGRIEALRELIPEAFAEGRVDIDALRRALGDEVDFGPERYGLTWAGKTEAVRSVQIASTGTLLPVPNESVNFDATQHVFIEGENLEVLKLLQRSYYGQIKLIYIDPPYNTGNDFVYPDDFRDGLQQYLRVTGQVGEDGARTTTNTETSGRFHSNWLTMMYPRLFLARNMLEDGGLIFVSIDDTEVANLRLIMDELFGEENFLACIAWEKRFTRSNNAKLFYSLKDSIVVYRRAETLALLREGRTEKSDSIYQNPDDDPRGPWTSSSYVNPATKAQRPNLVYAIRNPVTGQMVEHPTHAWKYSREEHARHVGESRLWWGRNGIATYPRLKNFLSETSERGLVPVDLWDHKTSGTTDEGGQEVKALFDGAAVFDNPKPTKLLKRIVKLATGQAGSGLVLDFFAGSGSTAQAVFELNEEDGGARRVILVQIPEPTPETSVARAEGFATISRVSAERIRRAARAVERQAAAQLDFRSEGSSARDVGFKFFRLESSNFRLWTSESAPVEPGALGQALTSFTDHVVKGRSDLDILYELILKAGLPLTAAIEIKDLSNGKVFWVDGGALAVCLERKLSQGLLRALWALCPRRVICLDLAFQGNDQLKVNAVLEARTHDIQFQTV